MPNRKLIEVALPLEAINIASAREKSIRHGHPSTLHLWWARRPLAAARAVIFAQMVDDPSEHTETLLSDPGKKRAATQELAKRRDAWSERKAKHEEAWRQGDQTAPAPGPEPTLQECVADIERERLFEIIRQLVQWENTTNEDVLNQARDEIWKSWRATCAENRDHPRAAELFNPDRLPAFHDPFAGGGSLPLEAQRLGLEAYASDLNPVAVLINKAMIEIPPKFAGRPPVNPEARGEKRLFTQTWRGAQGLAEDVRYYGKWMRDEAEKRVGHLYPKVKLPKEHGGGEATVVAWLWARTVKCPNPACGAQMPLVRSFWLSTKAGKQAWVEPVVDQSQQPPVVGFGVRSGIGRPRDGTVNRRGTTCLCCGTPVPFDHVRTEGKAGRMSSQLMAIVAEGAHGRIYLPPSAEHVRISESAVPTWRPDAALPHNPRDFKTPNYGMTTFADLFTPRQLVALTALSDLVGEARERVRRDGVAAGLSENGVSLEQGGTGATAYADAVATYLAFAIDKGADYWNTIATWMPRGTVGHTFSRQAIPMTWDYPEANPFSCFHCAWHETFEWVAEAIEDLPRVSSTATVRQENAIHATAGVDALVVSTDPPYYDNIGYADLSDFFYVWLRRSLAGIYPDLFGTLLVPKAQELVATPYRFGGDQEKAQDFFEQGLRQASQRIREVAHPVYPVTVYYAFKQSESGDDEGADDNGEAVAVSTGWETMLEALIHPGFQITGTWPMRTERSGRSMSIGTNALASSIVLVCRPRPDDAPLTTRRDFLNALKRELPPALRDLQRGNIAPVDLAQASIGPGMAIYSRYSRVLEADGSAMSVRTALALINQALDAYLAEQEGEYDADTRWALAWFEQFGFEEGPFGDAETLSKAKNTSVGGMVEAGILSARAGKARLLRREELAADWNPATDRRLTVWEVAQYLIRTMQEKGEPAAAELLAKVGGLGESARDLAYRLYTICERKGWAQEALPYNGLVVAWSDVGRMAGEKAREMPVQGVLF